jgi:glycosyltransferase involved in cell wall biosynthesis
MDARAVEENERGHDREQRERGIDRPACAPPAPPNPKWDVVVGVDRQTNCRVEVPLALGTGEYCQPSRPYDLISVGGRAPDDALRVALLTYRGNMHSGGQGVYVRHLSRALARLGHRVEVFSGPPYPELDDVPGVALTRLPSLDAIDLLELAAMCSAGFPEPLTFSLRAWRALRARRAEFDVAHDNQCLGYGLLGIRRSGLPLLATIHHPIQVDRRLELAHASGRRRLTLRRWYAFTTMQTRVARRLPRVITVSQSAREEIAAEMRLDPERIAVIPNGVNAEVFRPLAGVSRTPGRIVATASADVPLKGMAPLLRAFARVRAARPAELVVVGRPRPNGPIPPLLRELGLNGAVRFASGLPEEELVSLYAGAEAAVVPSLYEGFSLPAVEAMACAVPLVATTAGALPEVVGADGECALLVPPGDDAALAHGIARVLDDAGLRRQMGERGRARVLGCFTWEAAARATVERYREVMAGTC